LKTLLLACTVLMAAAPPSDVDRRVKDLVARMTLEEKIDYLGGQNGFQIRGVPRLGIPEVTMADGPLGVRNYGPSNYYPAGLALAATWDGELANRVGQMIGVDARARGVHIMLGPGMNIHRAPQCGRNFEYLGEDPFLASRMAVALIKGIQSRGVIATAKHFAANNQEWDRHHVSSDVDERTLREIYLPAFEASVKEGQVGAVMDSYNLVNGLHMTQNGRLNTDVLRREWGFSGILMSDWDATYDGVAAANNGLDLEMPSGTFMNRQTLLPAVKAGKVAAATIDEKVERILRTLLRFGLFDRPQRTAGAGRLNQEGRRVALEAARASMVLLKNDGLLPLDRGRLERIAVIGPRAQPSIPEGGGSAHVHPIVPGSFLEGIARAAGAATTILHAPGTSSPAWTARLTTTPGGDAGVVGEYFDNLTLAGKPALTRVDPQVNFHWPDRTSYRPGGPITRFSVRWAGYFQPRSSGEFTFHLAGGEPFRLFLDDEVVIDEWEAHEPSRWRTVRMQAGKSYRVRLEHAVRTGTRAIRLAIAPGGNTALDEAVELAGRADAVILCVGFDATDEGEGADRPFVLPDGQNELIRAVTAANRKTVVVLTAGGNVDMASWLDGAAALLHAFYPGQEGGVALGEILFGDVNPSGKLPVSLERRWQDNATAESYYDQGEGHVAYREGVFLGYRHLERRGIEPQFAFGHGLSYTTFSYSHLSVAPAAPADDQPVKVSFDVTNTGKRAGAEVAEVYVGDRHARVPRPVKELKGFARATLPPGRTSRLTVVLDRRAFSYYDVGEKRWRADAGDFEILVGGASDRIALTGKVTLR
jgi:beta-glucosidase